MFARDDYAFIKPESNQEYIEREESMERRQAAMSRYRRQQFELFEPEPECPYCTSSAGVAVYGPDGEERCTLCAGGVA